MLQFLQLVRAPLYLLFLYSYDLFAFSQNCFRALDREDNGTVHEAEFRQLLSTLGDSLHSSEVAEILREVTINRDGYIDYAKFIELITTKYIIEM